MSLRESVDDFLDAVGTKDFSRFLGYMNPDLPFRAILPSRIVNGYSDFVESQREWFRGETGTFEYQITGIESSGDLGVVYTMVNYSNLGPTGRSFALELFITFIFKKVATKWYPVFDQNTVLREQV